MICSQKQQDIHVFQWVKTQLLPHNQEPIKDVWKPAGYLHSHMYMQSHTQMKTAQAEQGKGCDIFNELKFLNQRSCSA